jgi:hypothetical protein
MGTHNVFREMCTALYRQTDIAFLVKDVHRRDCRKSVVFGKLLVHGRTYAAPRIGGVRFDDGPVHRLHEVFDEIRLEVVGSRRFPRVELYRHPAVCLQPQGLIDRHQTRRAYIAGHIDF